MHLDTIINSFVDAYGWDRTVGLLREAHDEGRANGAEQGALDATRRLYLRALERRDDFARTAPVLPASAE